MASLSVLDSHARPVPAGAEKDGKRGRGHFYLPCMAYYLMEIERFVGVDKEQSQQLPSRLTK
jgi:hypothetical protein